MQFTSEELMSTVTSNHNYNSNNHTILYTLYDSRKTIARKSIDVLLYTITPKRQPLMTNIPITSVTQPPSPIPVLKEFSV